MQLMNRIVCKTILLVIISSSAWGAVHTATHVAIDPGDCALCATNANLGAAPSESGTVLPPVAKATVNASISQGFKRASTIACPRPRGPPVSS
jgi:hypothetical protein